MKEICVNCKNNSNCKTREEVHEVNFKIAECEDFIEKGQETILERLAKLLADNNTCSSTTSIELAREIDKLYQAEIIKLKEVAIELKYTNSGRYFCTNQKECWAKQEQNECVTFENCQYKINQKDYELNKLKNEMSEI